MFGWVALNYYRSNACLRPVSYVVHARSFPPTQESPLIAARSDENIDCLVLRRSAIINSDTFIRLLQRAVITAVKKKGVVSQGSNTH